MCRVLCLFPRLANLVLIEGSEPDWICLVSRGQIVDSASLLVIFVCDLLCLLSTCLVLDESPLLQKTNELLLDHDIRGQMFEILAVLVIFLRK